jgi:hypothetical protein
MLLIVIEEIFVSDRHNLMESLKPLITNPRIEIQGKGVNQITGDNMVNGLTSANHVRFPQVCPILHRATMSGGFDA